MKFKELRENIKSFLKDRRKDKCTEISQEDIDLIQYTKYEIPTKTVFCFGFLYFLKFASNYLHLPSLFANPLADTEGIAFKRKLWSKVLSNHIIFLGTMGCFFLYTLKYEAMKFYLFLKYENLVNLYMDALDKQQINYLAKIDAENQGKIK